MTNIIYERRTEQPENPYSRLAPDQTYALIPEFTFESGHTLHDVPVAYKTWGVLNAAADNVMLVCHPLTRSVDIEDWWGELMGECPLTGEGKAIDESRFFIVCLNVMGSPYGSASPLTMNPETKTRYGPEFPLATIRDDVRIHKLVLDNLGVKSIAICIGGSMAGMHVYEWSFYGPEYVKALVPIAAPGKSSSWSMAWSEAQRQAIFADPKYLDGYYSLDAPPLQGLASARMVAMLTYRTRASYERRFGRNIMNIPDNPPSKVEDVTPVDYHRAIHNEGNHLYDKSTPASITSVSTSETAPFNLTPHTSTPSSLEPVLPIYATHSYLRYQASKFLERFDANCYIAMGRKMDAHDISEGREGVYEHVAASIVQPTLIFAIESDVLYPANEIRAMSDLLPASEFVLVLSQEGHDGLLLEHRQVNTSLVAFMQRQDHIRQILEQPPVPVPVRNVKGSLFASW
ncbi:homoserine O- acetyltransferase [Podila epicladia]|nr:homoserine O- acetyltransferase [Podila epicladia]KAG0095148.1 homoserine O- acetyltransferase [Podila epicladia]